MLKPLNKQTWKAVADSKKEKDISPILFGYLILLLCVLCFS